jgi:hypothetical protein
MQQIDLFKEEQRNEQAAAIAKATKSDDMLNTNYVKLHIIDVMRSKTLCGVYHKF